MTEMRAANGRAGDAATAMMPYSLRATWRAHRKQLMRCQPAAVVESMLLTCWANQLQWLIPCC